MSGERNWKDFWEAKAGPEVSNFGFDRGTSPPDHGVFNSPRRLPIVNST